MRAEMTIASADALAYQDIGEIKGLDDFPGLKPGDRWCLCAPRWREALEHGVAPPVDLMATHESALEYASLEDLLLHSIGQTT